MATRVAKIAVLALFLAPAAAQLKPAAGKKPHIGTCHSLAHAASLHMQQPPDQSWLRRRSSRIELNGSTETPTARERYYSGY
jgi:hypothetical protein